MHHHPTTRSDDEEIWDELTSEINRVAKRLDEMMAEAIRRAEEGRAETQASIANLHQHINTLKKSHRRRRNQLFAIQLVTDSSYKR